MISFSALDSENVLDFSNLSFTCARWFDPLDVARASSIAGSDVMLTSVRNAAVCLPSGTRDPLLLDIFLVAIFIPDGSDVSSVITVVILHNSNGF